MIWRHLTWTEICLNLSDWKETNYQWDICDWKKHTQPMRDLQTEKNAHRTKDEKLAGFRSNSYTGHPWLLWWEYSCGDQVVWWCLYMLSGVWSLSIETLYPHQSLRHPDQTRQRVTQTTLLLLLADDDRYQLSTLQMLKIHKNLTVITII